MDDHDWFALNESGAKPAQSSTGAAAIRDSINTSERGIQTITIDNRIYDEDYIKQMRALLMKISNQVNVGVITKAKETSKEIQRFLMR